MFAVKISAMLCEKIRLCDFVAEPFTLRKISKLCVDFLEIGSVFGLKINVTQYTISNIVY